MTPVALTIAGSDSGGGAGIQADLKAFARMGVHGTSAITAITAQSTVGVSAIHPVPGEMVLAQIRAVVSDMGVDAVKVGMLGTEEAALAVAQALTTLPAGVPVVVDPVMVSESGSRLLEPAAQRALVEQVLPLASVATPNLPEARALIGREPAAEEDAEEDAEEPQAQEIARAVLALGPAAVLLTGGHRRAATDLLVTGPETPALRFEGPRHPDGAAHGSGCTHSSLLAAALALGEDLPSAAATARRLAGEAVRDGLRDLGAGPGPVDVIGLRARREARTAD